MRRKQYRFCTAAKLFYIIQKITLTEVAHILKIFLTYKISGPDLIKWLQYHSHLGNLHGHRIT